MSIDTLFTTITLATLPAWALLLLAPRWRWTQRVVHSAAIPAVMSAAYVVMFAGLTFPEGAGEFSLASTMRAFAEPPVFLVAWIHFLVFDLFVGAWISRDALRRRVPHLAVVPCLVLTYMYGPAGLLLYLAVRVAVRKTLTLEEGAAR